MKGMLFWAAIFGIGAAGAQMRWDLPWWLPLSVGGALLIVLAPRLSAMTEPTNGATPPADFTVDRSPHAFRLGGVDYQAPAVIGGPTLKKAAALVAGMSGSGGDAEAGAAIDKIAEAFGILIPGPVGQAIRERIAADEANPIDLQREALPAFYWLIEQYGLRPTQPPSNSPDGSTEMTIPSETISSMGGALLGASDNPSSVQLTG